MAEKNSYHKGVGAEWRAAWLLRLKGYRIIARRYKTPVGEIDLIARRGSVLAFVEVKQRRTLDEALGAITPVMQRRITRAAHYFLADHAVYAQGAFTLRFDLMALGAGLWPVKHLDNIWGEDS